jgi:hypothetical protein
MPKSQIFARTSLLRKILVDFRSLNEITEKQKYARPETLEFLVFRLMAFAVFAHSIDFVSRSREAAIA